MSLDAFPKPEKITGGCLCASIKYEINFPSDHDFVFNSGTCQCNQCRKGSSSLFFCAIDVPTSSFTFTTDATKTLKAFSCSPGAERAFCANCGTWLSWRSVGKDIMSIAIGTIDPLYLWGEGADGVEVPVGGYGRVLASGNGLHFYCQNTIPGVTDRDSLINIAGHVGGTRFETEP